MKILKLDLRAFGPFTDLELDLSGGREGLHVIFGPNEAGKSTSLRALEQMFFGIPSRSSDNFVHSHQNLRVGATIARPGSTPLGFLRRKGAKNTLLAADNATPLEEAVLRPFLDGLDQDGFSKMFGIGHAQLVAGGREIVHGEGDVGQLLFGAGGGTANLRTIRQRLESHLDDLFRPRGSTQAINAKLRRLEDVKRRLREASLPSEQWITNRKELEAAQSRLAELDLQLQALQRQHNRLQRIQQAQPVIVKRAQCRAQLEELGKTRILPATFSRQRQDALTQLLLAEKTGDSAQAELDRIDRQLAELVIPESLCAQAGAIKLLPNKLGSHRKAMSDLPGLEAHRNRLELAAGEVLRQLRPELGLEAAEALRLTRAQQIEIQNLGSRHASLEQEFQQAGAAMADAAAALLDLQSQRPSLAAPRDSAGLKAALKRVQPQGDLEAELRQLAAAIRAGQDRLEADHARLPLWSGTLEQLQRLALPAAETVDRFEAEFAEADLQVRSLAEKLSEADTEQADLQRQIEQLRLEGEVPTEEDLKSARQLRDRGWELVRAAWQDGIATPDGAEEWLGPLQTPDLAEAFEQSIRAADDLSDRLRREAGRVARRATLQASHDAAARRAGALRQQLDAAWQAREGVQRAWDTLWAGLAVRPRSPREMRNWIGRHRALVEQAETLRGQQGQQAQLQERIATCRELLRQSLAAVDEPAEEGESLAALVDRVQSALDRIEAAAARREQWDQQARQARRQQEKAEAARARATEELAAWRGQWALAVEPLGLPPEASPAAANEVVARVAELFDKLKEAQSYAERIELIRRDAEAFSHEVAQVVARADATLAGQPVESAAEQLIARLNKATADRQARDQLLGQRQRHAAALEKARGDIDQAQVHLTTLCQEAGCTDYRDLPEVEQASANAARLRNLLESLEDQLLNLSGGALLEPFIAEAAEVPADDLPTRLARVDLDIQELESHRRQCAECIGSLRAEARTMDGNANAADAAEEVQELIAEIRSDAEQYARLKLALAVLEDGIDRYYRKNQGPILGRASELFCRLTGGSFESLRVDVDEKDERTLLGVRPGGRQTVGLSGMSDGAGDQLYLALRVASVEHYLDEHEPIPLVIDDILISFDDARSAAALEILGDLSARTQVLFFTHHQHLLDLARARLPAHVLFIHQLPAAQ